MKHIRKFNETKVTNDDLLEVKDLFKSISDEYNLSEVANDVLTQSLQNIVNFNLEEDRKRILNTYHLSMYKTSMIELFIYFDGNNDVIINDINSFISRLRGIGYTVEDELIDLNTVTAFRQLGSTLLTNAKITIYLK